MTHQVQALWDKTLSMASPPPGGGNKRSLQHCHQTLSGTSYAVKRLIMVMLLDTPQPEEAGRLWMLVPLLNLGSE